MPIDLPRRPAKLFYSYAHEDEAFREQLERHLALLQHQGLLEAWHDQKLALGTMSQVEIDRHINEADIILLLISADFLSSKYRYEVEMKRALERHQQGSATVIPVLVRPAELGDAPFATLTILPASGKPVSSWQESDAAWAEVSAYLRKLIVGDRPLRPGHRLAAAGGLVAAVLAAALVGTALLRPKRSAQREWPAAGMALSSSPCNVKSWSGPAPEIVSVRPAAKMSPQVDILVQNRTREAAVLQDLLVQIDECQEFRGPNESRVLVPMGTYDLELPCQTGCLRYSLPDPILLAQGDALVLRARLIRTADSGRTDPFLEDAYRFQLGIAGSPGGIFAREPLDSFALYQRVASTECAALLANGDRPHSSLVQTLCAEHR